MRRIKRWTQGIHFSALGGTSLYTVLRTYSKGLVRGALLTRASAAAFSLVMAVFPFSIFLITLLGNVRFLEDTLWELLAKTLPPNTYDTVYTYLTHEVFKDNNYSLLSFSFVIAGLLATNGIHALMKNFDHSYHRIQGRNSWQQYGVAFGTTFILTLLLLLCLYGIFKLENIHREHHLNGQALHDLLYQAAYYMRYLLVICFLFVALSIIYFVSFKKSPPWKTVLPGAFLSLLLIVLSSYGFGIYAVKFATYNELYGSIGTMLLLMLWIYINCIIIISGYELNAALVSERDKNRSLGR